MPGRIVIGTSSRADTGFVEEWHLRELGERAGKLAEEVPVVRMMFNNNRGADAPTAAQRMRELLGREVAA